MCSVNNDAVPAELDETQNHIQPVFVLETHRWAWYVTPTGIYMQISENFAVNDSRYYTVHLCYVLLIFSCKIVKVVDDMKCIFICACILPVSLQQNASVEIGLVKMNNKTCQM